MISVFASFVLGDDPTDQDVRPRAGVAVLLDATVVRMLVGAGLVMALLRPQGLVASPRLARPLAMPNLDVEGEHLHRAAGRFLVAARIPPRTPAS